MTADQPGLPGMVSASEHEADLRSRGDDPTPRGVVWAVLSRAVGDFAPMYLVPASDHLDGLGYGHPGEEQSRVTRVLDVCAGYGCWASELRRLALEQGWPVHITGVEIDERKREHLEKWCDEVFVSEHGTTLGDWRIFCDFASGPGNVAVDAGGDFDLVIGNPDFSQLTHDDPEQSMPAVLLRHAPAVLLLHTQQAFLKSEAGRAAWRAYPPAASWLVPGGVKFRGSTQGADSRCYQVTLWLRGHTGPCAVHLLDDLTPAERSWVKLPGTEDALEAKALGLPMVGEPHREGA